MNREQSYRDDVESFGYTLFELCRGTLHWGDRSKKDVCEAKQKLLRSIEQQTNKSVPKQIGECIAYAARLPFESIPDYEYIRSLLRLMIIGNSVLGERDAAKLFEAQMKQAREEVAQLELDAESAREVIEIR